MKIYLEHTINSFQVDLVVVEENGEKIAFEFKYKTKSIGNSRFASFGLAHDLANQSAQNEACYDYQYDVWRLEELKTSKMINAGYAIMLTNDNYWNSKGKRSGASYSAFRICDGITSSGRLDWIPPKSKGTRVKPIILRGSYTHSWNDYKPWGVLGSSTFKCLITEIK